MLVLVDYDRHIAFYSFFGFRIKSAYFVGSARPFSGLLFVLEFYELLFTSDCLMGKNEICRTVSLLQLVKLLKLEGNLVTIDLKDYYLPPVEVILGILVWMMKS